MLAHEDQLQGSLKECFPCFPGLVNIITVLLLLTTFASTCLKHSRNLGSTLLAAPDIPSPVPTVTTCLKGNSEIWLQMSVIFEKAELSACVKIDNYRELRFPPHSSILFFCRESRTTLNKHVRRKDMYLFPVNTPSLDQGSRGQFYKSSMQNCLQKVNKT